MYLLETISSDIYLFFCEYHVCIYLLGTVDYVVLRTYLALYSTIRGLIFSEFERLRISEKNYMCGM